MCIRTHTSKQQSVSGEAKCFLSLSPSPALPCLSLYFCLPPSPFHVLHVNGCEEALMRFLAVKNVSLNPEFDTHTCHRCMFFSLGVFALVVLKKDRICSLACLSLSLSLALSHSHSHSHYVSLSLTITMYLSLSLSLSALQ